jgi:hypothetical protein
MNGVYFYADYCTGTLWGIQREQGTWEGTLLLNNGQVNTISTFGEDEYGNLFLADHSNGIIYQVTDIIFSYSFHLPIIYH